MDFQTNVALAPYTALAVGGPAERLMIVESSQQLTEILRRPELAPFSVLGYGANVLISDDGLPGTALLVRNSHAEVADTTIVADAGMWWDDLVQLAISRGLWGLELTSGIPGSVGAAVVGNIAAYGQAVADTLAWVEVYDPASRDLRRLEPHELGLSYRFSAFQTEALKPLTITRAAFTLAASPLADLTYQTALDVAQELHSDLSTLSGRRQAILETRQRAGSLWDYTDPNPASHTAGSFFRNPLVDTETAERLMAADETGRTAETLRQMNKVHGGEQKRVSAAHVLLAAGFQRGQTWGPVRLHPDHILKIENTGGATAQQIYDVAQEIIYTVKTKLGIDLVPEVRFLGAFEN